MKPLLRERLNRTLQLTNGLAASLDATQLALRNGTAPSNSIGQQLWCVVGARESYARAIVAGNWLGFSCSLSADDAERVGPLQLALDTSAAALCAVVAEQELTSTRTAILIDVLEHEAVHHGQLIRYFYANGLGFPREFADRYSLEQPA